MKKQIANLREKAGRHKTLIQNFSYLSALQAFNMLLPLITYPYLIRILGANLYGLVIFAQVIATYLGVIVDYGFGLSATKDISIHRHDKTKLSEIISSVLILKLLLWILSLLVLTLLIDIIPQLNKEKLLFLFSFSICFNQLLFPQWYFQGVERMKYITITNLLARAVFLILIFLIVKDKTDYLYVPLLNGVGAFIGGVTGIYIMFVKDQNKFIIPSMATIKHHLIESSPLFGSKAIIAMKDRLNVIFIGAFLGMTDVAIYDLSIKIMTLFMNPIQIINNTIYPKVSRERNIKFAFRVAKNTFFIVLVMVLLIQPFLPTIVNFLSDGLMQAVPTTRILLIAPLIMTWSFTIAINCINALGKYKLLLNGMIATTLFFLIMIGLGYLIGWTNNLYFYIITVIAVYLFELLYRMFLVRKHKLLDLHENT